MKKIFKVLGLGYLVLMLELFMVLFIIKQASLITSGVVLVIFFGISIKLYLDYKKDTGIIKQIDFKLYTGISSLMIFNCMLGIFYFSNKPVSNNSLINTKQVKQKTVEKLTKASYEPKIKEYIEITKNIEVKFPKEELNYLSYGIFKSKDVFEISKKDSKGYYIKFYFDVLIPYQNAKVISPAGIKLPPESKMKDFYKSIFLSSDCQFYMSDKVFPILDTKPETKKLRTYYSVYSLDDFKLKVMKKHFGFYNDFIRNKALKLGSDNNWKTNSFNDNYKLCNTLIY